MELILIRHGLPEKRINEDGTPADPPLSQSGLQQADKMGAWLKDRKIDRLYSSPMQRALQTAAPLSDQKNLPIEIHEGVAEYDQKSKLYIPVEELKVLDYDRWKKLMSGETEINFPKFAKTVCDSLEEIIENNKGKRVAVTCHGGVINVWAAHVIGLKPRMFFNPNYTSINTFMAASSGEKSIVTLNEHSHLL
jgi:probable phosphoglycerate mutase